MLSPCPPRLPSLCKSILLQILVLFCLPSLPRALLQGEMKGLTTDSDVLLAPQLVGEPGVDLQGPLGSAQQALLLSMAEQVKRSTSAGNACTFAAALSPRTLPVSAASCIRACSNVSA